MGLRRVSLGRDTGSRPRGRRPTPASACRTRWAWTRVTYTLTSACTGRTGIFWHFMLQSRWCGLTILTGPDHTYQERRINGVV